MKVLDILNKLHMEENLPTIENTSKKKNGILLLDIDDTLLKATGMFIYRKLPTDKEEVALTPAQYADEHTTPENKKYYNYRDFRNSEKVYNSIKNGIPYINNLKVVDKFLRGGFTLGILTARGMEGAVYRGIKDFLKYRDKDGNLRPARISRNLVFAVNDDHKKYPGATDYAKKANVINKLKEKYDYVYFMDDDLKNIKAVKAMKNSLPEKDAKKIRTITATKPEKNLEEGTLLNEMAMKDLEDKNLISLIEQGKLKEAGYYYINKVIKENPARYKDLSWLESTQKILSYGVGKTVKTAVKKGMIDQAFGDKLMKAVQLAGADEPEAEKAKREEDKKNLESEKEEEKARKIEKASHKFATYEAAIERVEKEKKRIEDVKRNFVIKFLEKGIAKNYNKKVIDALVEDFRSDLEWIMNKLIPNFITSQPLPQEAKTRVRETAEGELLKERAATAKEYLELYARFLSRVVASYQLIAHDKELSDEEKENELATDKLFRRDFDKVIDIFKNRDRSIEARKLEFKALKAANKSDDDNKAATDTMKGYYASLRALERAYSSGTLREFVKNNFNDIRRMLQNSSYAVDAKQVDYKKPENFDDRPIEEEEGSENKFGPKVAEIAKQREDGSYSYSGVERDKPELNYLYKYYTEGKGNPDKVFKILANIYLDFIDGINTVISAKGKGLLRSKGDGKEKLKEITKKKETAQKMKKGGVEDLSVQEVKDVIQGTFSKIADEELKDRVSLAVKSLDLNKEDFEVRKKLVEASKRGERALFDALKEIPQVISNISGDNAKELLSKIIGRFSAAKRFEHRIAIGINFNGNRFSQDELNQLAKAAFEDPSNEKLNQMLKDPKFATRKTN